jgi:hypothetical protein
MGRSSLSKRENHGAKVICDRKTGSFLARVSALIPGLEGAQTDEGPDVFGSAEGVHFKAGYRWNAGGGYSDLKSMVFSRPSTETHDRKNRT